MTLPPSTRTGLLVLAAAQLWVLSTRGTIDDVLLTGIALSALLACEMWSPWLIHVNRNVGAVVISALLLCNFLTTLWRLEPPYPQRPLLVAILTGYGVAALQLLFASSRQRGRLVGPFALGVLLVSLDSSTPAPKVIEGRVRWHGVVAATTGPRWRLAPDRVISSEYPDNPDQYFEDSAAFQASWQLIVHDSGSAATLHTLREWPAAFRVDIQRASRREWFGIQLNQAPLRLAAGERYRVVFDARADAPRALSIAVSQGYPPWKGLGFSVVEPLDTRWRSIAHEFELPATDTLARLHIDLGFEAPSVEIRRLFLRRVRDGQLIQATPARVASVAYRINHQGCRGADPAHSADAQGLRLLAVGGSRFFGVGVHEADATPAVLQEQLRADTRNWHDQSAEVINCGAPGFALGEAAAVLGDWVSAYHPQAVLLEMGIPADSALIVQAQTDASTWRSRLPLLFRLGDRRAARRPQSAPPSTDSLVHAISAVRDVLRGRNARLIVVVPSYVGSDVQSPWLQMLLSRLHAEGISIADVRQGTGFIIPESLFVHPRFDAHVNATVHRQTGEALARALQTISPPLFSPNHLRP